MEGRITSCLKNSWWWWEGGNRKETECQGNTGNKPKDFTEQDDYYSILIAYGSARQPHLVLKFSELSAKPATQSLCAKICCLCIKLRKVVQEPRWQKRKSCKVPSGEQKVSRIKRWPREHRPPGIHGNLGEGIQLSTWSVLETTSNLA